MSKTTNDFRAARDGHQFESPQERLTPNEFAAAKKYLEVHKKGTSHRIDKASVNARLEFTAQVAKNPKQKSVMLPKKRPNRRRNQYTSFKARSAKQALFEAKRRRERKQNQQKLNSQQVSQEQPKPQQRPKEIGQAVDKQVHHRKKRADHRRAQKGNLHMRRIQRTSAQQRKKVYLELALREKKQQEAVKSIADKKMNSSNEKGKQNLNPQQQIVSRTTSVAGTHQGEGLSNIFQSINQKDDYEKRMMKSFNRQAEQKHDFDIDR